MATNPQTGLTKAQVEQQRAAGLVNNRQEDLTLSVRQIIAENTFTLFNLINVVIGVLIFTTGRYTNLLFLGIAILNTAIGTFQEIRAKRQVEHMSILNQEPARVRRDAKIVDIKQQDIVVGDILLTGLGGQLPVDGRLISDTPVEIDESPLTGEADAIAKHPGDVVYSGSFTVAGQGAIEVTAVADDTFAAKLAHEAKKGKATESELLRNINRIIQVLTYVLIPLSIALFTVSMVRRGNYNRAILTTSAAIIGMIPSGLVLMTNVALAVSSLTLARRRVLVRALPAIEALARVDTICLDKTGTITSGKLRVTAMLPQTGITVDQLSTTAAAVMYALNDDNETALAIKNYVKDKPNWQSTSTVPFSSSRKWSGASFTGDRNYFIGAPEFTFGTHLPADVHEQIQQAAADGLRVLVVGSAQALTPDIMQPQLLGLITIADELRPSAAETFGFFASQDVALKVISGDNPVTVARVAQLAEIEGAEHYIDMSTVPDDADFAGIMAANTVFGRVTPEQKKRLIAAYQDAGHTVAMTGDGVNDVLALRQADCAIAMASGSEAASAIADFVLLDSDFKAMTGVLNEGRRVINNIESIASLFLIKTMYSTALTALFIFINADYPIIPINLTPVSVIAVAIPSFMLSLEPNFSRVTGQFMRKVMTFAAPAAVEIVLYTMGLTFITWRLNLGFDINGTLVALTIACVSFNVLFRVARPFNRFKIGLVVLAAIFLFVVFFIINKPFSLANLWDFKLFLIYVPLIISTSPVYLFLQEFLGRRILSRIRWREAPKK